MSRDRANFQSWWAEYMREASQHRAAQAFDAAQAGSPTGTAPPNEDGNNYCRILTLLGMEEEGDPVAEVARLIAERDEWAAKAQDWRRKYAELRYPGMTKEVKAADLSVAVDCAGCGSMATPGGPCHSAEGSFPYVCVAYGSEGEPTGTAPPLHQNLSGLAAALRSQQQIDEDGVMVGVSRQAADEAAALVESLAGEPAGTAPSRQWRCFHCEEVFTDAEQAALHFGPRIYSDPACTVDAAKLRDLELRLDAYQQEDTVLHRAMYAMQGQHSTALIREEEKGYARGLADGMKEPRGEPTGTAPPEADALKDAARYRYLVGVWGFTIAEDLFGITTGRNVSVDLDAVIDENIEAHKEWRPK